MAGYLDHYGAGEERREKRIKRLVLTAVAVVIAAGVLFFIFKNYRQERQVNRFFDLLRSEPAKNGARRGSSGWCLPPLPWSSPRASCFSFSKTTARSAKSIASSTCWRARIISRPTPCGAAPPPILAAIINSPSS